MVRKNKKLNARAKKTHAITTASIIYWYHGTGCTCTILSSKRAIISATINPPATSLEKMTDEHKADEESIMVEEEEETMSSMDEDEFREEFLDTLNSVENKGEFATSSQLNNVPALQPKIVVQGLEEGERIAFPLLKFQAEQLRAIAEKAPYGKGKDTVTDENVRKAWQIDASKVSFSDNDGIWASTLNSVVQSCTAKLGLSGNQQNRCRANLYKMLLYERGGHFKKHRDTEKEPGMFGTLVVQLPSKHEGGALVIQHGGESKNYAYSTKSDEGFFATAFYADCEHELQPVTSGWRLCLVYNLVMPPTVLQTALPSAEDLTAQAVKLRRIAKCWDKSCSDLALGYLLEHQYTETNLGFSNLKGRDEQVLECLRNARDVDGRPLFVVCLLLIEKYKMGSCEGNDYGYSRRYGGYGSEDYDTGPHTMDDVHDEETRKSLWIGPDGSKMYDFRFGFDCDQSLLLPDGESFEDYFEDCNPDREEYEGFTGNAGPTLEYWYYKSAVVFWPKSNNLAVTKNAGISFLVSNLKLAIDSDVPSIATAIVEAVEKNPQSESYSKSSLLIGFLRVKDESLIVRLLRAVNMLPNNAFADTLVQVMSTMKSQKVNDTALALVSKFASIATRYSQPLSTVSYFLSCLKRNVQLLNMHSFTCGKIVNAVLQVGLIICKKLLKLRMSALIRILNCS